MKNILLLNQITKKKLALVGGKAANLGELYSTGFNVPTGFVVTTNAYNSMSKELKKEINETLERFKGPFAIRSSATAEDMAKLSFAGQYDTFLNVKKEDVVEHVRKCWVSLNTERAVFYRKQHKIKGKILMAVIVQEMVKADFAGIIFTFDPIHKKHVLVECAPGLGEAVVSGKLTPNDYFIDRNNFDIVDKKINVKEMDEDIIKELAKISIKIEQHFGNPQDIEFAVKNDEIFILQSRPITTL